MKIHPLLAQMIETLHFSMEAIVTGGAQRRRAYVEWNTAGKPVIEESTAQADIEDKHPEPNRTWLKARDVNNLIREKDAEIESWKIQAHLANEHRIRTDSRVKELENESILLTGGLDMEIEQLKNRLLNDEQHDSCRARIKELEAKLAEEKSRHLFCTHVFSTSTGKIVKIEEVQDDARNAALEEAAKEIVEYCNKCNGQVGNGYMRTDMADEIAARIRGMKK
jgi:hypothetical protein